MRKVLKWLAISVASLIGFAVLAVVGVLIALHTDWGREKVRTIAQSQLRPLLTGDIELGPIRGSVLSKFSIEGVKLKDKDGNVVVSAKRAAVNYRLLSLIDRKFEAQSVELIDPVILGKLDGNGVLNLSQLLAPQPPKEPGAPFLVEIGAVRIVNGLVVIPTATQTFSFAGVGLDAKVKIGAAVNQVDIIQARATWLERGLPVVAHGNVVHSEPLVAVAGFEVVAGASRVSIPIGMFRPQAQAAIAALDLDVKEQDMFLFWPHDFALGDVSLGGTVVRGGREQPVEARLVARALGGEVHIAASANPDVPSASGQIRVRGLVSPLPTMQAKLDADLSFDAAGKSLETLKGTVDLGARGMVMGRRIEDLQVAAVAGGGVARVDLTAEVPSAQATAHADLRLGQPLVLEAARIKAQVMDLGAAASIPNLDGQLDLEATARGTFDDLAVDGTADLRRVRSGENRVASARATFAMTGLPKDPRGQAKVLAKKVTAGKNPLGDVQLAVSAPGGKVLDVRVAQGGPGVVYAVRGAARIGLEERGTRVTLRELSATARGLTFQGKGGELLLRKNGSVAARDLDLRSPAGNIIVEGDLAPEKRNAGRVVSLPTGKLHVHLQELDLKKLQAAFAPEQAAVRPVSGKLSVDMHVVRDGKTLGFEGELIAAALSAGPTIPSIDATGRINVFKGKLVTAGHVRTTRPDGKGAGVADFAIESEVPVNLLDTKAWQSIELDEALKGARVTVRDLDLGAVAALAGKRGYDGRLDASLEGRPATRAVGFTVTVNDLVTPQAKGIDATVEGVWDHDALDTDTKVSLNGTEVAVVKAKVNAGLNSVINGVNVQKLPIAARVLVNKVQLASLRDVLPLGRRTEGVLTVDGSVKGTVEEPTGTAKVLIERPKLGRVAFQEVKASAALDATSIEGSVIASQVGGGSLEASGRVNRQKDSAVTARITAKSFDLGFLAGLARRSQTDALYGAGGILDADVNASMARGTRSANGRVQISKGSFYLPQTGLIQDIQLVATIDRGRVLLEKLTGNAASGNVTAGGEAILAGLTPERFRAELQTRRFPVDVGAMVVSVDTRGTISGQRGDEAWRMEASFTGTHVHTPKQRRTGAKLQRTGNLQDVVYTDVENFQQRTGLMALTGSPEMKKGGTQDMVLTVKTPNGVRVSGQDMDITARITDLVVYLRGGQSYVGGGVETSSGFIDLFDRRYDIVRARMSFDPSELPDPRLDVRLAHEFQSTTLFIDVGGTLSEPTLDLSAEPGSYDEAQLIGWVLGGDPDDPATGKQPIDERAMGMASNLVLGQVQTLLKSALPVDVLAVKVGEGSDTQTTRFEVGKWISDTLFLGYVYRMNAPEEKNLNEANIEYRLSRRWRLEAFFGDRGVLGTDLMWSKKY